MSKRIYIILFSFFSMIASNYGQSKKAFLEAAEDAFAKKNYYSALTFYNEVLQFDEKDANIIYKSAEAAREFDSYKLAAERYSYLIDTLQVIPDSSVYYYAGEMYQRLGQFDKATEYYDLYISQYGTEGEYLTEKSKKEKASATWAASRIKEVDPYAKVSRLDSDINSEFSDFGAFKHKDDIYYSSQRFIEVDPLEKPARQVAKIMVQKDGASNPIESDFNKKNKTVANHAFNTDKSRIYYTVCDYVTEHELRCDIYWSKVNEDGTFSDEQILPAPINDPSFTTTQPSFANDPISGNEIMYFTSNRTGGKGKLDVWYAVFDRKLGFSNPINLSEVNTPENEITPFYHNPTNILYFSTDGKTGYGGYDVFASQFENGKYLSSTIMPVPYNSSFHDVYYKLNEAGDEALFASNREGASFVDKLLQSCCYDVYKAEITPLIINLNALTFDKKSGADLKGATVRLVDQLTGKVVAEVTSDDNNEHKFQLEKGRNYLIIADKQGYKSDTLSFNTSEIMKSEEIIKKLYLETDNLEFEAFTFDANTRASLNGAKVTIEDLTDPENPVLVKVNETGNNFAFPLEKNKTYRITASRPGYGTVSENIDTRNVNGKITKNLYLPKTDINRLLPLALYFDNDEPDQDSKSTATDKIYGNIVREYMIRKPVFLEKYVKGVKANEKTGSLERMEEFFEGEVRGGYDKFSFFMDELIKALGEGQKIEMTIRGYASPRFDERYNLVLGQRRINSVRNDMMQYRSGALAPSLINKQLIITEISYGEELSPVDVIDNVNDEKGSIYSLKASKERKVEVISVKIK
jgi:tetratricopeptide (TPR) repeat protein